jgi:hypothetical protein
MTISRADYEHAMQSRYDQLDGKVVKGWPRAKEDAFKSLLAAVGYTADGAPPNDVLDFSDAAWARAEALIEDRTAAATDAERLALHRFNRESESP